MKFDVTSGIFVAAVFWVVMVVGVAWNSQAVDWLFFILPLPFLVAMYIHQWRLRRGTTTDKPHSVSARLLRWFYGESDET